jgi:hypothetical protein
MRTTYYFHLIVFVAFSTSFSLAAEAYSSNTDKMSTLWAPYLEWSLENPTYSGNPFDLIATVTFEHKASGETRSTEMFYEGGNTWKFRFTGTRTGEWTFITSSNDKDLDGKSGIVIINPNPNPNAHGFVKNFGNKWGWMGTEEAFVPQLVMYLNPSEYYNRPEAIDADIDTFFNEHGFNGFHTTVFCRWFNLDKDRYDDLGSDPNPDVRTFEALELLITKVHTSGGLVHIWSWGDEQRHMTTNKWGKNGIVDKRLQRYIAARLGPLPGWTMGYGFDCDEWVTENDLRNWHTYMHEHFGWSHFLGARDPNPNRPSDPLTQIYEGLDYSGYEHHRPLYEDYVRAIEARPTKPSFSEDRFRIHDHSPYPDKDYTEELTRRGLWHSTMAGGVANIWGNLVRSTSVTSLEPYPHPEWIMTYSEFFKQRFMKDMVRDNLITDGVCLKRPTDKHYLFYKETTSLIRINLTGMDGAQPAVAVDTKKLYAEINLGLLQPRDQTWTAPYVSDWAVALGDFGNLDSVALKRSLDK